MDSAAGAEQDNRGAELCETIPESELMVDKMDTRKLKVLYNGRFYNVTEFQRRCPGGNIMAMSLYSKSGKDATIVFRQFDNRSLKSVLAKLKKLATDEEIGLDPETRNRHAELTEHWLELTAQLEREGLLSPNPTRFAWRMLQRLVIFLGGLAVSHWLGQSSWAWRATYCTCIDATVGIVLALLLHDIL